MGATAFPRTGGEDMTAGQLEVLKDWVHDQTGQPVVGLAQVYKASVRTAWRVMWLHVGMHLSTLADGFRIAVLDHCSVGRRDCDRRCIRR
jgi:hypothetical protein